MSRSCRRPCKVAWTNAGAPTRHTMTPPAASMDHLELFPADNVSGIHPDVLRKACDWHIPLLRWPGGNFASGYHWQDGIGRHEARPTRRNAAWGGIEPNHFGTEEFLRFCR